MSERDIFSGHDAYLNQLKAETIRATVRVAATKPGVRKPSKSNTTKNERSTASVKNAASTKSTGGPITGMKKPVANAPQKKKK